MIGKVNIIRTGYDPAKGRETIDPTLEPGYVAINPPCCPKCDRVMRDVPLVSRGATCTPDGTVIGAGWVCFNTNCDNLAVFASITAADTSRT